MDNQYECDDCPQGFECCRIKNDPGRFYKALANAVHVKMPPKGFGGNRRGRRRTPMLDEGLTNRSG
jgi:hypothetical protein